MTPTRAVILVLFVACLAVAAPTGAAQPPPRCHLGDSTRVEVVRGKLSCPEARRVMRRYARNERSPKGWKCRAARGSEDWEAQCRRLDGPAPRAVVRTYPIMT